MQREIVLGISAVAVLLAGCLDRKRINADASAGADAGAVALDAGEPSEARSDGKGSTEPGGGDARDIGLSAELPGAGEGGMPADSSAEPPLGGDAPPDPGPDSRAATDLGADLPMLPDAAPDLPLVPDVAEDGARLGCVIGGQWFGPETMNPSNPCQSCQPSFAVASWTTAANGATCGTGSVCSSGACQSGCWIDGALVASGATHPTNPCQLCKPVAATGVWSTTADGTSCGTGRVCGAGTCQAGCFIGGVVYASGAPNPSNTCQSCVPALSPSAWYQAPSHCASIAAHDGFTCATVGSAGTCWGRNGWRVPEAPRFTGALGTGQSFDQLPYSLVPLTVSGLGSGVHAVSQGSESWHACAIVNGAAKCWGWNLYGQLGDGTTTDRDAPVQVAGLASGVGGIAIGARHSCAIANRRIMCWGDNASGQLGRAGDGSPDPASVSLSGSIQAITAGNGYSCALVSGSVWCWGENGTGQLGNTSIIGGWAPVQVASLGGEAQAITAGARHACAIAGGGVMCWGGNQSGQLGDGTTTDRLAPVPVQGLPNGVQAVVAGGAHTCAVANGAAWCWGSNWNGQLGDNSTVDHWTPVSVSQLGTVLAITAGSSHTCAVTTTGAKCWGANSYGQLGNDSVTDSQSPVSVQGL